MNAAAWRAGAFACIVLLPLSAQAEERILAFADQINIGANGTLSVAERLSVDVTGEQIIHGIYRDIPIGGPDNGGHSIGSGFNITLLRRDAAPEHYVLSQIQGGYEIKIGDPDVVLDHRMHAYEIGYRLDNGVYVGNGAGVLYWNVTGNYWSFPIDRATARVNLPSGAQVSSVDFFTGPRGSTDHDGTARPGKTYATFETSTTLVPGEGLTIVVCFNFDAKEADWTSAIHDDAMVQRLCRARVAGIIHRTIAS